MDIKSRKEVEGFILSLPSARLDYPFGEDVAVYKVMVVGEEQMFALMPESADPIRLSLKCDPTLAVLLRKKYDTILEGYHLNKKHWNTILLTGQVADDEIQALIVHSYNLVIGTKGHIPEFK